MRSAALSVDITPPLGLPIGGNVRKDNISRGVHDKLFCNIILLEDGKEKVCFLSLDLLGLHYDSCNQIKTAVSLKTGLATGKIVINCIHTHSGPDVLDFFKEEISCECLEYVSNISREIADGVAIAINGLQETKIRVSKSEIHDLSFNRRLVMKDGSMKMNWEYPGEKEVARVAGPIDPELIVVSLADNDGDIKALIINFALHTAVLVGQDWLWSRDYVNYLDSCIKRALGKDVVILFMNGAEGNINHIDFRNKNQGRGFEEAERIGEKLGEYVLETIKISASLENNHRLVSSASAKTAAPSASNYLACVSSEIELPFRKISNKEIDYAAELWEKCGGVVPALVDGCPDEIYAAQIIKLSKREKACAATEIMAVRLNEDTVAVTLPGEVFTEFGLQIKKASGYQNTIIIGLANDCIGYIPTKEAFSEGGYEIKTATSSQLDPMAGSILVNKVLELLDKLN